MKVVCESCHAKYQVPDARVAGKKLKIRCKRCGETVLIRGDLMRAGTDDAATVAAPVPGSGGIEWHVSVEGEVSGPYATSELISWLATSPAGWDAFVWREGFPIWLEARNCDEVVAAAGGAPSMQVESHENSETQVVQSGEEEARTRMFQSDADEAFTHAQMAAPARASMAPAAARSSMSSRPGVYPASGAFVGQSARTSARPNAMSTAAYGSQPSHSSIAPGPYGSQPHVARVDMPSSVRAHSAPAHVSQSRPRLPTPSASQLNAPSAIRSRAPSSPHVSAVAPAAVSGAHDDESVLFSTQNLRQVAQSGSQPGHYVSGSQPGFAKGEGSGLIDIRALATLAQQQHAASMAPRLGTGGFDAADPRALHRQGALGRMDSIAPISTARPRPSSALPIAVFSGFALVAAAAFAAILITRNPNLAAGTAPVTAPTAAPVVEQAPLVAAAAQPVAAVEPVVTVEPIVAAPAPAPTEEEAKVEAVAPAPVREKEREEIAAEKRASKRQSRNARTAEGEKKQATPEEKPKEKEKEKAAPPSLDDVMLAEKTEPKEAKEEVPSEEVAEAPSSKGSSDIDDLLGVAPAKEPAKSRSIDDLIDGAVAKKSAPASAPTAEVLPESPSRDETLAAMRGIEPAVRECASAEGVVGTAEVQIQVSGSTGRVTSANVGGISGPAGACIAKAARNAKFPRFSKPSFAVKFPYRFK